MGPGADGSSCLGYVVVADVDALQLPPPRRWLGGRGVDDDFVYVIEAHDFDLGGSLPDHDGRWARGRYDEAGLLCRGGDGKTDEDSDAEQQTHEPVPLAPPNSTGRRKRTRDPPGCRDCRDR